MRKWILGLAVLFSLSALAQQLEVVEREAQNLVADLMNEGHKLNQAQRGAIMEHLRAIRNIMNDSSYNPGKPGDNNGPRNPRQDQNYICVSRDNDGRAPYQIALRDGLQVRRVSAETFTTASDCQNAVNSQRRLGSLNLLCVSRDNDGRAPYQLADLQADNINGPSLSRISRTVVSTASSCQSLLNNLRDNRGAALFCTSRDNDGSAPYTAAQLNTRSGRVEVSNESFQTAYDCHRFIGQR